MVNRPSEERFPGMVATQRHRVDETEPGCIRHRGAIPEVIRADGLGGVVDANAFLKIGAAGPQPDDHRPFGAINPLGLTHRHPLRPVFLRRQDLDADGHHAADRVALRAGVPLDPAAGPGPAQGNEAGLDHVVDVKHRLAGGLVQHVVDLAAQFGQEGDAQVFVLEDHGAVAVAGLFPAQKIEHGVGIDVHLVRPAKAGMPVRRPGVGRELELPGGGGDRAGRGQRRGCRAEGGDQRLEEEALRQEAPHEVSR